MGWTENELARIGSAKEAQLATVGSGGRLRRPVTVWVLRVGDNLYVRSWLGREARWYRSLQSRGDGHIGAGGVERDIVLVPAGGAVDDAVDEGYRGKYLHAGSHLEQMIAPRARATTLEIRPR